MIRKMNKGQFFQGLALAKNIATEYFFASAPELEQRHFICIRLKQHYRDEALVNIDPTSFILLFADLLLLIVTQQFAQTRINLRNLGVAPVRQRAE
jgi:hypothetical protein